MDNLIGLKENVIIGKLIPVGTGMKRYRSIRLNTDENEKVRAAENDESEAASVEQGADIRESEEIGGANDGDVYDESREPEEGMSDSPEDDGEGVSGSPEDDGEGVSGSPEDDGEGISVNPEDAEDDASETEESENPDELALVGTRE